MPRRRVRYEELGGMRSATRRDFVFRDSSVATLPQNDAMFRENTGRPPPVSPIAEKGSTYHMVAFPESLKEGSQEWAE